MTTDPLRLGKTFEARFVARPNRFLVHCDSETHGLIEAFMPNPGRMRELLLPGTKLRIRPAPPGSARKTRFEAVAVMRHGAPILLHTGLTNAVARHLLETGRVPGLELARILRAEAPVGRHRFDFLLEDGRGEIYVEVKSCTLFANGVAMFPDAVTERGRRHVLKLTEMARQGTRGAVIFIVHHGGVSSFMPDYHTDPEFSRALFESRKDIAVLPLAVSWTPALRLRQEVKCLPVPWDYVDRETQDAGAYLLVLHLRRARTVNMGDAGNLKFREGYYVYVAEAGADLTKRIAGHLRRRKRMEHDIDPLRAVAYHVEALPIRSSGRIGCAVAAALARVLEPCPAGFAHEGCTSPTHLYYTTADPQILAAFHEVVEDFRMRGPE